MDSLLDALYQAFLHVYHADKSNAAMHCAPVRYSPITFRLAEQIDQLQPTSNEVLPDVYWVMKDRGEYEEDAGR